MWSLLKICLYTKLSFLQQIRIVIKLLCIDLNIIESIFINNQHSSSEYHLRALLRQMIPVAGNLPLATSSQLLFVSSLGHFLCKSGRKAPFPFLSALRDFVDLIIEHFRLSMVICDQNEGHFNNSMLILVSWNFQFILLYGKCTVSVS